MRSLGLPLSLLLVLIAGVGCSAAGGSAECNVPTDCASNVCNPNGTCAPAGTGGTGGSGTADAGEDVADGAAGEDGEPPADGPGDAAEDGTSGVCQPNHDGILTRAEVPIQVGLHATFKIAANATWDTTGTDVGGAKTWDLSGDFSGDHLSILETQSLTGLWFAPDFPGATYASRLSDTEDLLGIFEVTADALLLRGVASPAEGLTRTKLTYTPPVTVLQFPLQEGSTWATTSKVTGLASGVVSSYTEAYANQVDTRGTLKTPYSTFDVLRVRIVLTRTLGVLTTVTRTFAFVTECFGNIAAVTSQSNEAKTEFTSILEVKRLSP